MQLQTFPLFYHPSTVILVDDEPFFLKTMVQTIEGGAACKGFSNPKEALDYLNNLQQTPVLLKEELDQNHEFLISPLHLKEFLSGNKRFNWVTTVVVDFTMPNMNGFEFCKKLKSPYLRKIMLTGDAGLDVAIQALNSGVINKFFRKSDPKLLAAMNDAIIEAQFEYFSAQSQRFYDSLTNKADLPYWFHGPQVIAFLVDLMQKTYMVEFYVLNELGDILLLNQQGQAYFLLMRDER